MRKPSLGSSPTPTDLRPLTVDIYENGIQNFSPDGFDGYSSVQVSTFIDTTFPPRFPQQLTHIYKDVTSIGQPINQDDWVPIATTASSVGIAANRIVILDWELADESHYIVLLVNTTSTGQTYQIPSPLVGVTGYRNTSIVNFEMDADSSVYLGTADGAVFGNSPVSVVTAGYTVASVVLNRIYAALEE